MSWVMASWEDLQGELDAWRASGRTATFWWRDDDATRPTAPLDRLLDLSRAHGTPVALAVIPRDAGDALAGHLEHRPLTAVLQHGWGHANHAPDDSRQEEYGPHRPMADRVAELDQGRQRLQWFPRSLPVFVAPWNRMDPELLPRLPEAGLTGVSVLGPRAKAEPAPGVRQVNVHVDIIDWPGSRGFVGLEEALARVLGHLRLRREATADPAEPTGLMTHHGFHDEGCWWFIDAFLAFTRPQEGVRWLDAGEAFGR